MISDAASDVLRETREMFATAPKMWHKGGWRGRDGSVCLMGGVRIFAGDGTKLYTEVQRVLDARAQELGFSSAMHYNDAHTGAASVADVVSFIDAVMLAVGASLCQAPRWARAGDEGVPSWYREPVVFRPTCDGAELARAPITVRRLRPVETIHTGDLELATAG